VGLRELKKERTRRLISETAHRLFAERGFEAVRVAEVARAAEVSEATVFNYFPAKEDLFFSGLEDTGARIVDAVRDRAPDEPVLAACRRALLSGNEWLEAIDAGDAEALERARTVTRVIGGSPALQARERLGLARNAEALAAELGGDVAARVVAGAVSGLHAELIRHTRQLVTEAPEMGGLTAAAHAHGTRAFDLLERGLADYGRRDGPYVAVSGS
jgi:AcrR family transcriptional regulator